MFILCAIVGFSIGITFFGEMGRLFGVDDNPIHITLFRMIVFALIIYLAIYAGWGQDWTPEDSLNYHLTTGLFTVIGLIARDPASEIEYEMGLSRLLNPLILRFQPKAYRNSQARVISSELDSFVQLAVYFFGHRQGLNILPLVQRMSWMDKIDERKIQTVIDTQTRDNQSASLILGRLATSNPAKFVKTVDRLLQFAALSGLADNNFVQRLYIIAGGEGLRSRQYDVLLDKYGLRMIWSEYSSQNKTHSTAGGHTSERDRNLHVLGLNQGASMKEIKKAFRRLAKIYHPDRNVGKPEREQAEAAKKMRALNLAFDWLQTNS